MTTLAGRNIVVIDCETATSAGDCRGCGYAILTTGDWRQMPPCPAYPEGHQPRGWENKVALGLSIGCYYSYQDGQLHWFDRATLEAMLFGFVAKQSLLASFDGIGFKFPLMVALLGQEAEGLSVREWVRQSGLITLCTNFTRLYQTSYDVLAEIWKADPAGKSKHGLNTLDGISQACGLTAKAMDGTAPRLWAQGRYAEVIENNVQNVLKTKALFERCVATGELRRSDGQAVAVARPTLPPQINVLP